MCAELLELVSVLFYPQISTLSCVQVPQSGHLESCALPLEVFHIRVNLRSLWQVIGDVHIILFRVVKLEFGLWAMRLQLRGHRLNHHGSLGCKAIGNSGRAAEGSTSLGSKLMRLAEAVLFTLIQMMVFMFKTGVLFHHPLPYKPLIVSTFQLVWQR